MKSELYIGQLSKIGMAKVIFGLNKRYDIWNCLDTIQNPSAHGHTWKIHPALLDKIKDKSENEVKKIIGAFAGRAYEEESQAFESTLEDFRASWQSIEKEFFKRLKQILQKPICAETFHAYLTTLSERCPWFYEKKAWMVFYRASPSMVQKICAHELLHMQFKRWHQAICLEYLTNEQKEHLREALTFLLNEEFSDLIQAKDLGYPAHQKLRAELAEEWRKDKNFERFLPKAIEITKRMMK